MKFEITLKQLNNLTKAIQFWLKVPRTSVVNGLGCWRETTDVTSRPTCGSSACFGGWLPHSPYFAKLGVKINTDSAYSKGTPVLFVADEILLGKDVALHLFGTRDLFATKGFFSQDYDLWRSMGENASEWGLVLLRLAYVIDNAKLVKNV